MHEEKHNYQMVSGSKKIKGKPMVNNGFKLDHLISSLNEKSQCMSDHVHAVWLSFQ